jgi:hypothetical protein
MTFLNLFLQNLEKMSNLSSSEKDNSLSSKSETPHQVSEEGKIQVCTKKCVRGSQDLASTVVNVLETFFDSTKYKERKANPVEECFKVPV